jgi:hypothetical protein
VGLLDRFRPQGGLTHSDPETRLAAVQQITAADLALLVPVVRGDADARVRRAAIRRLRDPHLLAEVAGGDADTGVREAAAAVLLGIALEGKDEEAALAALKGLSETRHVTAVARSAALESVARAALAGLADDRALGNVARHGEHAALRVEALRRMSDDREIAVIALKTEDREIALEAVEKITDAGALESVADRARNRAAARRARERLKSPDVDDAGAPVQRPATDRAAQMRLIETAEALSGSEEWDEIAARLAALQDAWIEEIPEVDDDLDERFRAACRAARHRLQAWHQERAEREVRERELEQRLGPRRRLCEAAEAAVDTAVIDEARAAWRELPDVEGDEAATLGERFEAACRAAAERRERLARTEQEAGERARVEQEAKEAEHLRRDNAARLERLCAQAETLLKSEKATLGKLERAAREVRAAVQTPPPLPSQREHDQIVHRLRTIQTDLLPKIQGLRDTDRWQRWANAAVQEELCAKMEDLARAAEEEGADLATAAKGLRELMERWKAAGPAPPDRSLSLWNRFKTARDRVRARADLLYAQQAEEHAANLKRKEALCEQAEALSGATDWAKTTEAIKALQTEWKAVGPASRGQERAIWERFRKACDSFFARRDEDMARRKDEWTRALRAKEALCARAEALADSTDWRATAEEIKKLQAEWKTLGPVRRSQSEAIWNRFRAACDRFFERFKNRDAIEREGLTVEREDLIREVEALSPQLVTAAVTAALPAPADPPATPGQDAQAEAVAPATPPAPPETLAAPATPGPEELLGRLRASLERWRRMRGLPHDQIAPLNLRFFGAFDRVLAAHPQVFAGTSLDAEANRKRMEDLVLRVEKIVPAGAEPEVSGLSPAERLATMWREALASNTMGGRVAEETRWKAATEEVRKAQAAWQRLGYVSDPARRALESRFEKACRRILDRRGQVQAARTPRA